MIKTLSSFSLQTLLNFWHIYKQENMDDILRDALILRDFTLYKAVAVCLRAISWIKKIKYSEILKYPLI